MLIFNLWPRTYRRNSLDLSSFSEGVSDPNLWPTKREWKSKSQDESSLSNIFTNEVIRTIKGAVLVKDPEHSGSQLLGWFKGQGRGGLATTSSVDVCVKVRGKTTESLFCGMALTTMTEWRTTLTVAGREEQNSWHWFSTYIDNVACWGIYWRDKEPHKSPYYHLGDIYFTYKHALRPTHGWSYYKDNLLC